MRVTVECDVQAVHEASEWLRDAAGAMALKCRKYREKSGAYPSARKEPVEMSCTYAPLELNNWNRGDGNVPSVSATT